VNEWDGGDRPEPWWQVVSGAVLLGAVVWFGLVLVGVAR
jgi:hypothetical protein